MDYCNIKIQDSEISTDTCESHPILKEEKQKIQKNTVFASEYAFFIFINTASTEGKHIGMDYLQGNDDQFETQMQEQKQGKQKENKVWNKDKVEFKLEDGKVHINVYFIDLLKEYSREKGFQTLKYLQETFQEIECRIIVCGGDGSIIWVLEELRNHQLDLTKQVICPIAGGTGNDFSRALGWPVTAGDAIGHHKFTEKYLKKLAHKWIRCALKKHDIWDIEVDTLDKGYIHQYKTINKVKQPVKLDNGILKCHMVSYFSVGVDAEVGYRFEKNRSRRRFVNKFFYFWEGLKKLLSSNQSISDVIQSFNVLQNGKNRSIFRGNEDFDIEAQMVKKNVNYLGYNYINMACQNITSYCAGQVHMFKNANNSGLKDGDNCRRPSQIFAKQDSGDGMLEYLGYRNIFLFILERYISGNGYKLFQGSGPFFVDFKEFDKKGEQLKTYFQVDGEYYEIIGPRSVKIEKSKDFPNSQMTVMLGDDYED